MADKKLRARLTELRNANEADLSAAVVNARKSIYQFHKDRVSKPQENVKIVKNSRKEIARIMTIRRERDLAAAKEG